MRVFRRYARRLVKTKTDIPADRFQSEYVSDANAIIIGGVPRSGTTLMRVMLDSHPHICCGPESRLFLPHPIDRATLATNFDMPRATVDAFFDRAGSRAEFIDLVMAEYCRVTGKPRWAEKTPRNLNQLAFIFRAFPNARFIHMIRDGRDVACSLRTLPRHKVVNGELVPLNTWKPIGPSIERWVNYIEESRRYHDDPRYIEVRYENLVLDPRPALERVLTFLGEPWADEVLHYHEIDSPSRDVSKFPQNPEATQSIQTKSLGRWQRDFSDEDKAIFKEIGGPLLIELGYETSNDW
jgi:hypothetical protein